MEWNFIEDVDDERQKSLYKGSYWIRMWPKKEEERLSIMLRWNTGILQVQR